MPLKVWALLAVAAVALLADGSLNRHRLEAQDREALADFTRLAASHKRLEKLQRPPEVVFVAGKIREDQSLTVLFSWPAGAQVAGVEGTDLGTTPLTLSDDRVPARLRFTKAGYNPQELPKSGIVEARLTRTTAGWLSDHLLGWLAALALAGSLGLGLRYRRERPATRDDLAEEPHAAWPQVEEGAKLGRYRLGRRLGQGAQAEVFLGTDEDGGRSYAVKVLFAQVCQDPEYCMRFEREAEICRQLQHPRVVRVHYSGITSDKRWWMVQDFMPNGTLKDYLEARGALPPGEAARMLMQMAEGLAYAHSKGITHRDFKPDNVLLDEDGEPVVADFGMARAARYQTITHEDATLGTPAYMPPEQVKGLRPDHRADLYSLGVVGYQMLSGRLPFEGDLITTMMAHMTSEPPPLDPALPEGLVAVVMRLLQKEPEQRFASAQEVREALAPYAANSSEGRAEPR